MMPLDAAKLDATSHIDHCDNASHHPMARLLSSSRLLLGDRNGRIGTVAHHVDIVRLYDELGIRIRFLFRHDLTKLRIVVRRIEALVPLLLGGIAANVNERVLGGVKFQFGVAGNWSVSLRYFSFEVGTGGKTLACG